MLNTYESAENIQNPRKRYVVFFAVLLIIVVLFVTLRLVQTTLATPDPEFPIDTDIVITEGMTQNEIAELLEVQNVVRSSLYFYLLFTEEYPGEFVKAGTYRFKEPMTTRAVAESLVSGTNRAPLIRFTLPEGFSAKELTTYLPENLTEGNPRTDFTEYEGYLFPDTYFIGSDTTLDEVVTLLRETFNEKIEGEKGLILESGFTLEEVITFASIIEREAKDVESKKIVSGILQNRLEIGMPLQVDAVFDYLLGKESSELTKEDLSLDSPYNTYLYVGLPPGPIANPGLESIRAVLEPTPNDYLYYLTGSDGVFHYAETFEEHKRNKIRYLE